MTDTCRYPGCDRAAGFDAAGYAVRARRFCSKAHAIKHDHLQADARERAAEDARPDRVADDLEGRR